jgi:hypothetical protein
MMRISTGLEFHQNGLSPALALVKWRMLWEALCDWNHTI